MIYTYISILLLNLKLLGFASHDILVDEQLFTRNRVNYRAFEVVSYFLFSCIDPKKTKEAFQHCWPVSDAASSRKYIQVAYQWLNDLRYKHDFLLQVSVRKSTLQECYGEEMERIMMAFSTAALELALKNKTVKHLDKKQIEKHIDTISIEFEQLEKHHKTQKRKPRLPTTHRRTSVSSVSSLKRSQTPSTSLDYTDTIENQPVLAQLPSNPPSHSLRPTYDVDFPKQGIKRVNTEKHEAHIPKKIRTSSVDTSDPIFPKASPIPSHSSYPPKPSTENHEEDSDDNEPTLPQQDIPLLIGAFTATVIRQQVSKILSYRPEHSDEASLYALPLLHNEPTEQADIELPCLSDTILYPPSPSLHLGTNNQYAQVSQHLSLSPLADAPSEHEMETPKTNLSSYAFDDLESVASLGNECPPWRQINMESKMFDIDIYTPHR